MTRPLDRRNRKWGTLANAVDLRAQISKRAKQILDALRYQDEGRVSYGAVIEKLAEEQARKISAQKVEK